MVRNYKIKPKVYSLEKLRVAVGSVVCKEITASQASRFYQIVLVSGRAVKNPARSRAGLPSGRGL